MIMCQQINCTNKVTAKGYCEKHYRQLLRKGKISDVDYRHGMYGTKIHTIWRGMKQRGSDPNHDKHKNYWDKGIRISEEWKKFSCFLKDMLESYNQHVLIHGEKNTTIERIDNGGNYCKENCRWATYQEQWENKDNARLITFNGVTKTLSNWARDMKISHRALSHRLDNWDFDSAMTLPKLDNITRHNFKIVKHAKNS